MLNIAWQKKNTSLSYQHVALFSKWRIAYNDSLSSLGFNQQRAGAWNWQVQCQTSLNNGITMDNTFIKVPTRNALSRRPWTMASSNALNSGNSKQIQPCVTRQTQDKHLCNQNRVLYFVIILAILLNLLYYQKNKFLLLLSALLFKRCLQSNKSSDRFDVDLLKRWGKDVTSEVTFFNSKTRNARRPWRDPKNVYFTFSTIVDINLVYSLHNVIRNS